ncbi:MAG TPA: transglutaminase family protein [Leucothrix mucor]|uniref:Transglutaminase family protein n=1 Tax=Leucothrix mucor TaxID=45248 RepID=A0A7V2T0N3_LEUMU|nr:transglutaminase family protein [Leucothrix mucor]
MNKYLQSTQLIDWKTPNINIKAQQLTKGLNSPLEIAKACFIYVRDEIKHSNDYQLNPITCKASDVLEYKTGYCYAKSHLLAALLRANNIPAGLCYQRLTVTDKPPFCLHGLNAVYLEDFGWYRIDARGNKAGISAQFTPPQEQLAYPIMTKGEADLPEVWAEPLPMVIEVLESFNTYRQVAENLPDIELYSRSISKLDS